MTISGANAIDAAAAVGAMVPSSSDVFDAGAARGVGAELARLALELELASIGPSLAVRPHTFSP